MLRGDLPEELAMDTEALEAATKILLSAQLRPLVELFTVPGSVDILMVARSRWRTEADLPRWADDGGRVE